MRLQQAKCFIIPALTPPLWRIHCSGR